MNELLNERFNEKSQDKKGHKATYTCPWLSDNALKN